MKSYCSADINILEDIFSLRDAARNSCEFCNFCWQAFTELFARERARDVSDDILLMEYSGPVYLETQSWDEGKRVHDRPTILVGVEVTGKIGLQTICIMELTTVKGKYSRVSERKWPFSAYLIVY